MSGYIAEFVAPDGSTATLSGDDVIAPTVPDEHSVINEWSFETPASPSLEAFRHGRVTLWFEAEGDRRLIQTGPIEAVTTDDERGRTTVRAHDDFQTLAETGPDGTIVADGEAADEIEAVWSETPFEADVIKPEPRPVAEGRVIQDGDLTEVFSELAADETQPFIIEDGRLQVAQTAFVIEGEDRNSGFSSAVTTVSDTEYSGGAAVTKAEGFTEQANAVFTDFDALAYTIPEEHVGFATRFEVTDDTEMDPPPELFFNGEKVDENQVVFAEVGWTSHTENPLTDGFDYSGGDLTPSTDLEAEIVYPDGAQHFGYNTDVVVIYDERYYDFTSWDNSVHEPDGYLDDPVEILDSIQAVADTVDVPNSITAAELTVASDTGNNQSIALEFGPDDDFTADLSADNSETLSGDNPDGFDAEIRGAVTLGNKGQIRDTQTPRTGFEAQELTSWELAVDEVSIIVFNGREFSGDYYQILQEMHREGGLIFRNIPTEGDELEAETFEKGALSDDVEWTRLGFDRGFESMTEYANVLTAVGGEADDGTRPVVEVSEEDEIDRVGEEKPAFRLFESRTDERALLNRAQAELRGLTDDQLSGSVEIVPRRLKPGYAYEVPAFDGETVVLQRMRFEDGTQPRGSLEFLQRRDVSNAISGVRRETRTGER